MLKLTATVFTEMFNQLGKKLRYQLWYISCSNLTWRLTSSSDRTSSVETWIAMGVALQIRSNQNWIGKSPTWICFVTCDFLGERQGIVIPIYTGSGAARKSNGANFVGKNRSANFVRRCGCCCNRHLYKLVTKWIASAQRVTSILPTFESTYACNRRCY